VARYCHLPVGRLGADWVLDAADALLGRSLRDAGHLLWAADPALPDVAGRGAAAAAEAALADEPPSMEVGLLPCRLPFDELLGASCSAMQLAGRPAAQHGSQPHAVSTTA